MRNSADGYSIGVDIGGTFTDVVVLSRAGEIVAGKSATTPASLADGVLDAIGDAAGSMGLGLEELLAATSLVKHGSTVATNALLTRRGARIGLITTRGFEDTPLIMRAVGRVDGLPEDAIRHVASVTKPAPLVPRERIRGVRERISATGEVVVPLVLDDVRGAARELIEDEEVEGLAVSLLQSWANPAHERAIRDLVEATYGSDRVYLSFGSELSSVAGEYARTNTALANAFVGPTVERYLRNLASRLESAGFGGRLLIMQGNGGLAAPGQTTPISTLQSGPAGGMIAAAHIGERLGHERVITADMGGTSFDVGLVDAGYWRYADEPIFERLRILQPIIDITSIGAGGGTIARVDAATGRLLVGPESAGAAPGPVCYGTGGTEPTVTDCDLVLGLIDPAYFLGGRRALDVDAARRAVDERLARPLGMSIEGAAAGVIRIVDSQMGDLIRREVVKSGHLPEEFVLYAFGGAGPVHAIGFARDLAIRSIHVFPTSAVLSAFGIAMADLVHTRVATRYLPLPVEPDVLNEDLEGLEELLAGYLRDDGFRETPEFRRYLTMRFRRQTQGEEITFPWSRFDRARVVELERLFVERYEELYGSGVAYAEAGIDIGAVRVDAIGRVERPDMPTHPVGSEDANVARKGSRRVYHDGGWADADIYDQTRLAAGMRVHGPAIVESSFTTVVLPPGSSAEVDAFKSLVIAP